MADITWTASDRDPVVWANLTDDYGAAYWESRVAPGIWSWLRKRGRMVRADPQGMEG